METQTLSLLTGGLNIHPAIVILLVIWTLAWKGYALWRSAELRQKWWFIALLIVNTLGILEIIYIFFVARKYKVEVIEEKEG